MNNYLLNIAGYRIRFKSEPGGIELVPSKKFMNFICHDSDEDIIIDVFSGKFRIPAGAKMVFNAPYIEEINGIRLKKSDKFWSIYKTEKEIFISISFPLSVKNRKGLIRLSPGAKEWNMWLDGSAGETDPMEYPADGLILYYLTALSGDIMIHASGVNHAGKGYLFSGISGKGKTTMARIWDKEKAMIIHDDRLIIRKTDGGYRMYNTPVYNNETPRDSMLDKIFLIEHGNKNQMIPLYGAGCASLVMANCIQHNWDPEMIERLLGSVTEMCNALPVSKLLFRPDRSVIDSILNNE